MSVDVLTATIVVALPNVETTKSRKKRNTDMTNGRTRLRLIIARRFNGLPKSRSPKSSERLPAKHRDGASRPLINPCFAQTEAVLFSLFLGLESTTIRFDS